MLQYTTQACVIRVSGKDGIDLLHRLSTADLRPLKTHPGNLPTVFTNAQGRIIDWCHVIRTDDDLFLIGSPNRASTIIAWLEQFTIMEDVTYTHLIDWHVVQTFDEISICEGIVIPGLDAWGNNSLTIGPHQSTSISKGSYEIRRVIAGIPSSEHEFPTQVNPLELRLKPYIAWDKGCYIGQEVISRIDSYNKLSWVLMGFSCASPAQQSVDAKLRLDGKPLGRVTSWVNTEQGSAGLAIVKASEAYPQTIEVFSNDVTYAAQLEDRPFWKNT